MAIITRLVGSKETTHHDVNVEHIIMCVVCLTFEQRHDDKDIK